MRASSHITTSFSHTFALYFQFKTMFTGADTIARASDSRCRVTVGIQLGPFTFKRQASQALALHPDTVSVS